MNTQETNDGCPAHLVRIAVVSPSSDKLPHVVHLQKTELTCGRKEGEVDMLLDSSRVPRMISRVHAKILQLPDTNQDGMHMWKIVDNKSVNGIFVNSVKVAEAILHDGDVITFGGGGMMAMGVKKDQEKESEFVYRFSFTNGDSQKKRKATEPTTTSLGQGIDPEREQEQDARASATAPPPTTTTTTTAQSPQYAPAPPSPVTTGAKKQKKYPPGEGSASPERQLQQQQEQLQQQQEQERLRQEEEKKRLKLMEELNAKTQAMEEQARRLKELENLLEANRREMDQLARQQQEKDFLLTQQKASFHEQLVKIQTEFEAKKSVIEEEKKHIQQETEKQSQLMSASRQKLEQELQLKQQAIETMSKDVIHTNDLEEEFTCTICQELILCAMTLECSHSFCNGCITGWLDKKKQCPICRELISKSPVRSRALDNAIAKIVSKLGPEEKKEWEERVSQQAKQADEDANYKKLLELVNTAKSRNLKFLNVTDHWSPEERKVFLDGVSRYSGKARALYCESTGLTQHFVETASIVALRSAGTNVGLALTPDVLYNTNELRKRLTNFINNVQ